MIGAKKTFLFGFVIIPILSYSTYILYGRFLSHPSSLNDYQPMKYLPLVLNKWHPVDSLGTMKTVFDNLDFKMMNATDGKDFDVLWTIEYPFDFFPEFIEEFTGGQIINHIPGITYITNKKYLATTTVSKYLPVAFDLPHLKNEFLFYVKNYPEKKYVVKNFDNRGVKMIDPNTVSFNLGEDRFVQEMITNPMLIDGHAFDLGVYVLITSIEPLRMYRWKSDIFLRFCREVYHPFDPENRNSYVVAENHKNYWEMPSLQDVTEKLNGSAYDAFVHYLELNNLNMDDLWAKIDDAIVTLTLQKLRHIARHVDRFFKLHSEKSPKLFELVRCDFILDENFNLFLMEINMSPNLTPTKAAHSRHSLMYEKVVFSTVNLVGIPARDHKIRVEDKSMFSTLEDIVTGIDDCLSCIDDEGKFDCKSESCQLCPACLSSGMINELHMAFREHQRRGNFLRIFPNIDYTTEENKKMLSKPSQLMTDWYKRKCENDPDWC